MKARTALDSLSSHTSDFLAVCHAYGLSVTEDVITTNNLVYLKQHLPRTMVAWDSRPWEATIGCDLEMWLGSNGKGWCGYAIQAKRMHIPSGNYTSLAHQNAFGDQIDLLENYATRAGINPLYLFYNSHVPYTSNLCNSPYTMHTQGCTIAPSSLVRHALSTRGARNFRFVHESGQAALWRCLTCPAAPAPSCDCLPRSMQPQPFRELPSRIRAALDTGEPPAGIYDDYGKRYTSKALLVIDTSKDES